MSKTFATADEIAAAIVIAWRMNEAPSDREKGEPPEWVVERLLLPNHRNRVSRNAIYAWDMLTWLRPRCDMNALARGIGFASYNAANSAQGLARRSPWFNEQLRRDMRKALFDAIGTDPQAPRREPTMCFTPRSAGSLGATALHATELPRPRTAGPRRPLTDREKAMNLVMMGDPIRD